jgi:hypothetical protein
LRPSHAEVDLAGHETFELDRSDHLAAVEFYIGKYLPRRAQQPRQHDVRGGRRVSDDDDAEVASGDPLHGLRCTLGELEDASRVGEKGDAGGGGLPEGRCRRNFR